MTGEGTGVILTRAAGGAHGQAGAVTIALHPVWSASSQLGRGRLIP